MIAARWMLALLLLLHPLRGAMAAWPEPSGPGPACTADGCCPLCAAAPACPCSAAPEPGDPPEPLTLPAKPDAARAAPGDATAEVGLEPSVARAPKVARSRPPAGVPGPVNAFLSVVCVWTI